MQPTFPPPTGGDSDAASDASRAALHRSDVPLQLVLESATDYAIITTDLGGIITGWNSGAEQILGWSKAEVLGHSVELLFTPEGIVAGVPTDEMRVALDQGRAADERWHIRRSGERFWAAGTMMPMRDPNGEAVGYLKILRDQTQQHQAEQALRRSEAALAASEARFRATFEQSAVSIAHIGLDGRWLRVNGLLCAMLGYTEDELLARTLRDITYPDDRRIDREDALRLLAGEIAGYSVEKRYLRKDGTALWANSTLSLARDLSSGAPLHFIAVTRSIDDRKQAEAALAESEARLRNLLATLDLGTLMARDLDGTIRFWSKGCVRLYGWTAAEAVGRNAHELLRTVFPVSLAEMEAALARDGEWTGDLRHRARDGREMVVTARKVLCRDAEGRPADVLEALTDVTEARRAEARLRESEDALRQAQKMEAIGRLAAGVAHDFNNILQGVVGSLELVLDEVEAGTSAHEFAELALSSARRGADLTSHLLSYARKQMLRPQAIEIAPFLSDMQKLLRRTLGPHIRVEVLVDQATLPVEVDPGQLQTALLNLAINAAHAMPKGGTLSLEARSDSETEQRWVTIAVTDTGTGMDAATLARACEPFFTTKGLDGTGLGLSMVQGFIEQSGGEVRIASAPGQGTTVQLWLPTARPLSYPSEQQSVPVQLRGSGRVLLVDDVSDVLVTAGAFLERAGFRVTCAESGDQALALLIAGERFDALVSDYAMPGLNGLDLIEQARAIQPNLPALLITGFAEVDRADVLSEAVQVLRKPFQRRQLVEAMLQAVGHGEGSFQAEAPPGAISRQA